MASSWAIDKALIARLLTDSQLAALATGGVWRNIAPQGQTKFVILELLGSADTGMFQGRAFENATYLVKYVEKSSSDLNAMAAADRIDALLESATIFVDGFSPVTVRRSERVGYADVDDANNRWQHFGGLYDV